MEDTPLGNAGVLFKMRSELGDETSLLLKAGVVLDIDFAKFTQFHKRHGGL